MTMLEEATKAEKDGLLQEWFDGLSPYEKDMLEAEITEALDTMSKAFQEFNEVVRDVFAEAMDSLNEIMASWSEAMMECQDRDA